MKHPTCKLLKQVLTLCKNSFLNLGKKYFNEFCNMKALANLSVQPRRHFWLTKARKVTFC